jgi:WD40 repeat protein
MPNLEVVKSSTLTGHKDCIYTLERSDENSCFYSAGGDGMIVLWDLNSPDKGELVAKVEKSVYALHYLESKHSLLIGENFEGVHEIDLKEKKEIHSSKISSSYIFDIKSLGDRVYVASGDGNLIILDKEDLSTIAKIKLSDKSARCLAINEKRQELAIGYSDNFCRILNLQNLEVIATIPGHQNSIFSLSYSPDNNYLLSGSRDAHLKIWDTEQDYQLKESIVAHMYAINHIVYSPDGNYFATCSMDKSIKIWDAHEFQLLKVIDRARHAGHGTSVNKLFWSAHHGQLISGSDDRSISVWDIKFGLN